MSQQIIDFLMSSKGYYAVLGVLSIYTLFPQIKKGMFIRKKGYLDDELVRETFLISTSQTFDFILMYIICLSTIQPIGAEDLNKSIIEKVSSISFCVGLFFGLLFSFKLLFKADSLNTISRFSSFKYKVNHLSYLVCLIFCVYSIVHCWESIPSMGDSIDVGSVVYKVFAWPIVTMSAMSFNWTYKFLTEEPK